MEEKMFMIFDVSELDLINFEEVMCTSKDTIRKNVDGTKTFVKWIGKTPPSVKSLQTKDGPYTLKEMLYILENSNW